MIQKKLDLTSHPLSSDSCTEALKGHMLHIGWLCFLAFLLLPSLALAELDIVSTTPTLASIARELTGHHAKVQALASNSEDPHFVSPRPDFILKLNRADLLLYNGMELEIGWLPPIQKNARNPKVLPGGSGLFDASSAITPLGVPTEKIDRAQGDVHPQGNPHYLYALPNVIKVAHALTTKLSTLDPSNAADYQQNLALFIQKANEKDAQFKKRFSELTPDQRRIISYHDSMIYLVQWLALDQVGTIEPLPGVAPGPSHITKLVSDLKQNPIHYIVQENDKPKSTSEKVAKLLQAKLVVIDPGPKEGESLFDYFDRTVNLFF